MGHARAISGNAFAIIHLFFCFLAAVLRKWSSFLSEIVVQRAMWVVYVFLLWCYFSHIYPTITFYFRYRCSVLDKVPGSAIPKQDPLETTEQGHRVVSSLARLHCNHGFAIYKCSFCFLCRWVSAIWISRHRSSTCLLALHWSREQESKRPRWCSLELKSLPFL